ncbi:MAG TPA: DNA polymerase IV [Candidatus Pullichristensenella excrementipullorum]|nr:DNA polymerase IV [Candidatus Pullichristensenella excrementipullorum]
MGADRLIFHCDCNNFYASCECLERPELKSVPMAVAGDPEYRTGIVVAKNELAKKAGVKTTDTVWQAKRKCPGIVFVPPRHSFYEEVSERVNAIYHEYTEYLEPASIDESYLDMTGVPKYYGLTPVELADLLRKRVREDIGITISVGVSYNKAFAKMGSDYKKPDATTLITKDNFQELLWPLPVSDLLFAGRATVEILHKKMIFTIGDLAQREREYLRNLLGKGGEQLWIYANGLDQGRVRQWGEEDEIKSVSRGMTFRRDLVTVQEIRSGLSVLADDVATELRRKNLKGSVVQVQIKTPALKSYSRQTTLKHYTYLQKEILDEAFKLLKNNWNIGLSAPVRALTVGMTHLVPADQTSEQLSLFDMGLGSDNPQIRRERQERLEAAVDHLRQKHGNNMITRGFWDNEDIGISRNKKEK